MVEVNLLSVPNLLDIITSVWELVVAVAMEEILAPQLFKLLVHGVRALQEVECPVIIHLPLLCTVQLVHNGHRHHLMLQELHTLLHRPLIRQHRHLTLRVPPPT